MLEDLGILAVEAKKKCDQYDKMDFILSDLFKEAFKSSMTNNTVEFNNYTCIIVSKSGLAIIAPNQWFKIASFFSNYLPQLLEYKRIVSDLKLSVLDIKNIRETQYIDNKIENLIDSKLSKKDAERLKRFLTDYDWWFGSKTIDRGDFFISSVLGLAGVINDSQSYIAALALHLSKNPNLIQILEKTIDVSEFFRSEPTSSPLTKAKNTIYYGSPGTGKSYKVNETLNPLDKKFYERITFHPEYDHASFVGTYKPITEDTDDGEVLKYKFVPQVFTNIYIRAWQDPANQYYLAIEEINRGNCAEIFGDIFQLLDRTGNYTVTPDEALKKHLIKELNPTHEGVVNGLKLPPNLSLLATMNTSDQSLFPMDSAFKRRWDWEYIPICYTATYESGGEIKENESFKYRVKIGDETFKWIEFIEAVNKIIRQNENLGMDKCIGNYFIKSDTHEINLKEFINKAIFYLWNDVFKDEEDANSIFKRGTFYEDFFPVDTKGLELVSEILDALSIHRTTITASTEGSII